LTACSTVDPATGSALDVGAWVHAKTGECENPQKQTIEEFANFVGPLRAKLYAPYIEEWATCAVSPYEKLGLVVLRGERRTEFQKAWKTSLTTGEITDDPDFAFGNGFALTATTGLERLGLRYLHCKPVGKEALSPEPAEVEGCTYAKMPKEHEH
jgi:hypothetical protein